MAPEKNVPTSELPPAKPAPETAAQRYSESLAMPEDDDPAGDGHMWSGKSDAAAAPARESAEKS